MKTAAIYAMTMLAGYALGMVMRDHINVAFFVGFLVVIAAYGLGAAVEKGI